MGQCSNCGSTGGLTPTCATKLSEILWDGGSTCFGWSGTNPVELILALSQAVCSLSNELGQFAVTSDDVSYNGDTLTTWITTISATVAQNTAALAALNGTKVIHYDNTTTTLTSGNNTYGTLKSFSVPANTLKEVFDYLIVEFTLANARTDYGDEAKYKVSIGGATVLNPFIEDGTSKTSTIGLRCQITLVRLNTNTISGDYWVLLDKGYSAKIPNYDVTTNATPIIFTNANTLLIEGYNETGSISCTNLRVTKVLKSISI